MKIIPIPCFQDNYSYLIVCTQTRNAAIVDPPDSKELLEILQQNDLKLVCILNTHHHWDHVEGNLSLCTQFPELQVYAHTSDQGRIPGQTHFLKDQDSVCIGNLKGTAFHTPGHTSGGISYHFDSASGSVLFSGDTLFGAGCGRLFEGTPEQLYHSLNRTIAMLPPETQIYFGHEYTRSNLLFAQHVEPNNLAVQQRLEQLKDSSASKKSSSPSSLKLEAATNPFLRCNSPEILKTLQNSGWNQDLTPVEVFTHLRQMKDQF